MKRADSGCQLAPMSQNDAAAPASLVETSTPVSPMIPSSMRTTQVCCVARHVERADSAFALYRGAPYVQSEDYAQYPFDPPLSDDGERGALELAQEVKACTERLETTIHVVIASPFLRCAQTAAVICRELGPSTILMFDESCGEIYGQAIFGPTQPDVVHRDFASVVEDCKARGVTRIAPVCVGSKLHWGETLQDGRQRFNEAFLGYVHRGTEKTRNFLVVTHADCVAAAATLLPGARDISKVHPGAVLMAQRIRPIGPGDGWSIMSSERSDEKRTEKIVLKSLSRAQGWKVDSSNIDFCTTQRSKEGVMKRMVASFRKFTARSKLGEDRVKYLLKAFSGDRRRATNLGSPPSSPMSSSSHGSHAIDPALWIFACEEGDCLARMPTARTSGAWLKASPRTPRGRRTHSPVGSKSPRTPSPPGRANKLSIPKARGHGSGEEEPKTLRALIIKSGNPGSTSTTIGAGMAPMEDLADSEISSSSNKLTPPVTPKPKALPKAYLQLPFAGLRRGGVKDMSSSPLWKRRQKSAGNTPSPSASMSLAEVMKSPFGNPPDGMTLTEITSPVEGHGREALESHKASPELDHSASMPSIATKPMAATPCMAPLSAMKAPVRFAGSEPWNLPLPLKEPHSMELPHMPAEPAKNLPELNSFALARPKSRG